MRKISLLSFLVAATDPATAVSFAAGTSNVSFQTDAMSPPTLTPDQDAIWAITRTATQGGVVWQVLAVTDENTTLAPVGTPPYPMPVTSVTYSPSAPGLTTNEVSDVGLKALGAIVHLSRATR